ncbi:MAG: hypothetical protein AAGE84_10215 [Cyanobacteria bacterium P01_G01_bin.39]
MVETNFLIGCAGAAAPEVLRLYNLRAKATVKWNPNYILFSIPFFLIGGFIAWIVDPPTKLAAFYSGLSAPFIITTALKDNAKEEKELLTIQTEIAKLRYQLNDSETEKSKLEKKINELNQKLEPNLELETNLELEPLPDFYSPWDEEELSFELEESPIEIIDKEILSLKNSNKKITIENGNYNERITANYDSHILNYFSLTLITIIAVAIFSFFLANQSTLPDISKILELLIKHGSYLGIIVIFCLLLIFIWSLRKNKLFKRFIKGL